MFDSRLFLDTEDCYEEGAEFIARENGGVTIEVSEEKAVDSYNASFTCTATLDLGQAIQLRDWLNGLGLNK